MDKKIPVSEITQGMFVSALDRPWRDTPFLLQGFLVETPEDVANLRRYCRHVYIDLAKSAGEQFERELALEQKAAAEASRPRVVTVQKPASPTHTQDERHPPRPLAVPAARPAKGRADPCAEKTPKARRTGRRPAQHSVSVASTERTALLESAEDRSARGAVPGGTSDPVGHVETWAPRLTEGRFGLRWIRSLVDRFRGEEFDDDRHGGPLEESGGWQPPPRVVIYHEVETLADELPRAEKTMERAQVALKDLVTDVESKGALRIEKAEEIVGELVDSMVRNPNALMWLARLKNLDARAYSHSLESAIYMVAVGLQLGLDRAELATLSTAGLMLDVGKLRVPSQLLERPGKLTETEFAAVKRHVQYGLDILSSSDGVDPRVTEAVARHHEREDGSGYPHGLKGDAIGLYGRIAGIVDTYVAVTNPRPYAGTLSPHDGVRALYRWRERIFHEPLVEVFVHSIGVFPVGSMVELSSGDVAIVVAHNRVRRLKPRVLLVTGPDKTPLSRPTPLDLLYAPGGPGGRELAIARSLPPGAFGIDPREYYVQ
jgi:HD-GYP domain-containing protein (c-di-GMP phosphodiesterase class II)